MAAFSDHRGDEAVVLAELDRQRRAHGVAAARRVANDLVMQKALTQINTNSASSSTALNQVVQETVDARSHSASGYLVETTDVKRLKFDPVLLASSTLDVEIGVTHYRAAGAAWGQYVVLFVITDHGAMTHMAKRELEHRAVF